MGKPSVEQQFAMLAAIGANTDWGSLTTEELQLGITEAARAGAEFTAFVRNGCQTVTAGPFRETGELTIEIPALRRPTLQEIKATYPWVDRIELDASPTSPVILRLATVLLPREEAVNGANYERRLIPHQGLLLGLQHRDWLISHQDELPEPAQSVLKSLLGKVYIDFPGIIVVHSDGVRSFPDCYEDAGRWDGSWHWLDGVFDQYGRLAVSGK